MLQKKNILLGSMILGLGLFAQNTVCNADDAIMEKAQTPLALYGLVDLEAANEYLEPQGLEAVEVSPGKTLSGFVVIHWNETKLGPVTLKNYKTNAIPLLASRKDGQVRNAYYFGDWTSDNFIYRSASAMAGLEIAEASYVYDINPGFPTTANAASVSLPNCDASIGCKQNGLFIDLKMGPSKIGELQATEGVVLDLPVLLPKARGGQTVYDAQMVGTEYRRPFDPTRDTFWVAPGSIQGKLFKKGNFKPTQWSIGRDMDAVSRNMRVIKD